MEWRASNKNDVIMIYGFRKDEKCYDAILTLIKRDDRTTEACGFLSRSALSVFDLRGLYTLLLNVIKTEILQFEVLPESFHSEFYQRFLPIEEILRSKTFDGFDCEILRVKIR